MSGALTLPWATSSLCAADAAFTSALVAAAIDLAASKICSSKFRLSSASCSKNTSQHYHHFCHIAGILVDFFSACWMKNNTMASRFVSDGIGNENDSRHDAYEKSSYETQIFIFHTISGLPFFPAQTVWSKQEHVDLLIPRKLQLLVQHKVSTISKQGKAPLHLPRLMCHS